MTLFDSEEMNQIQAETDAGIAKGWEGAHVQWRKMALNCLLELCLTQKSFTVNDFRDSVRASQIKTHDNRAMGGVMVTAKKLGWITPTGSSIISRVGHKSQLQVWKSNLKK